jgi:uncharacterized membrane protein
MSLPAYLWHPIFVHFSIALLTVATGFYLLAGIFRKAASRGHWISIAEWTLWLGLGFTACTLLFGWIAFNTVSHDSDAVHELMEQHALLALITSGGFALVTLWSFRHRKESSYPCWPFIGLMLVCCGLLATTGWRGGDLVYHHALAVDLPPRPVSGAPASGAEQPAAIDKGVPPSPAHHHHHGKDHAH